MPIQYSINSNTGDAVQNVTVSSVDLGTGPNRAIVVLCTMGEGAVRSGTNTCKINPAGANEDIPQLTEAQVNNGQETLVFYKYSPTAVGTGNSVKVDISPEFNATTMQVTARLFTQTSGRRTQYSATGLSGVPTVTVADSLSGDLVVDNLGVFPNNSNAPPDPAVGAGQTQRSSVTNASANKEARAKTSDEAATGANTVMSWADVGGVNWATIAFALAPGAAGSQVIWIWFQHQQKFLQDLKRGLIPPDLLRRRYREVFAWTV